MSDRVWPSRKQTVFTTWRFRKKREDTQIHVELLRYKDTRELTTRLVTGHGTLNTSEGRTYTCVEKQKREGIGVKSVKTDVQLP